MVKKTDASPAPGDYSRVAEFLRGLAGDKLRFIHIAGTNGKGSTAAFLERILREAGYKTGLFTSPHIVCYNERIRINGEEISHEALNAYRAELKIAQAQAKVSLGYFSEATAIALMHFSKNDCDIVLLECGLGGRLDPTNFIKNPELTLITRLGLEHTDKLGNTLEQIAWEKAGVVKPGADVVCLKQQARANRIIARVCFVQEARLHFVERLPVFYEKGWFLRVGEKLQPLGIGGAFQSENAALALYAAKLLQNKGWKITDKSVYHGLQKASWAARFEQINDDPPIVFDGAHNPQGADAMLKSLRVRWPDGKFIFIMGCMEDKDFELSISKIAPHARAMIAVAPIVERALNAQTLANAMRTYADDVFAADDMKNALQYAKGALKHSDDCCAICVFGSLYLAAPLKQALGC
ncbi:bifunctional folylpolyglutamate synthase/dihydrofolate synthase [Eubacteriales bacterium OttesenSCG-928-K08]|nr:bifunctional folylpolyglutamate synthase/dihydrofolate synthase [Eubacteriales bacterium OttesenSCG-928-K08]